MKYETLKPRMLGFGFYLSKSPSINDPMGLWRWCLVINIGIWFWKHTWYRGIGVVHDPKELEMIHE